MNDADEIFTSETFEEIMKQKQANREDMLEPGTKLGCHKSYLLTRMAYLDRQYELRDMEPYEEIFKKGVQELSKQQTEADKPEKSGWRKVTLDCRENKNMKDNLEIVIPNTGELKLPKQIIQAAKLMEEGCMKMNEFDVSVNLYMHLYRPHQSKWPIKDVSDNFAASFKKAENVTDIGKQREVFQAAWAPTNNAKATVKLSSESHKTLICKDNLKQIFSNHTLNNYQDHRGNTSQGMVSRDIHSNPNKEVDYRTNMERLKSEINFNSKEASVGRDGASQKYHNKFRPQYLDSLKQECAKHVGPGSWLASNRHQKFDNQYGERQRKYYRQTTSDVTDRSNMGQYSIYNNPFLIDH